jgi:hypothetical protein
MKARNLKVKGISMNRILVSVIVAVVSATPLFAQSGESVQTGFVVLQPVVGSGVGLTVFGRVALRNGAGLFQSNVWAGSVVTATTLVVSSDQSSGQDTGIAIINASNFSATVTLTMTNQQGTVVATRTFTLAALHQTSRFVSELLGVNATGLLSISSTAPIAVLGLQYTGMVFSLVPTNAPPGETALVLPQVATGNGWSTQVVIANGAATTQTVRVDFYNADGVIITTLPSVTISPGALTVINR